MTDAIDFPSGPWTGFYQLDGRRLPQDLELTFDDGVIRGGGWDGVGEFVVKGSYDAESGEVRCTISAIWRPCSLEPPRNSVSSWPASGRFMAMLNAAMRTTCCGPAALFCSNQIQASGMLAATRTKVRMV